MKGKKGGGEKEKETMPPPRFLDVKAKRKAEKVSRKNIKACVRVSERWELGWRKHRAMLNTGPLQGKWRWVEVTMHASASSQQQVVWLYPEQLVWSLAQGREPLARVVLSVCRSEMGHLRISV